MKGKQPLTKSNKLVIFKKNKLKPVNIGFISIDRAICALHTNQDIYITSASAWYENYPCEWFLKVPPDGRPLEGEWNWSD